MLTKRCAIQLFSTRVFSALNVHNSQVAISHLAWAVGKSCSSPAPEKVHEGDYWTQHAKNFIDLREKELRPATAEATKEHIHKVASGIVNEIKTAAFEEGNATALKVPQCKMNRKYDTPSAFYFSLSCMLVHRKLWPGPQAPHATDSEACKYASRSLQKAAA